MASKELDDELKRALQNDDKLSRALKEKSEKLKQLDLFYREPQLDLASKEEEKPEDCIPDLPENEEVRKFLATAPTKGLWMPLGKEVKVMQCWRCKRYGHRTGDRECPLATKGNIFNEQFRMAHEDPMYHMCRQEDKEQNEEIRLKEIRVAQMKTLLQQTDSDSDNKKKKKKKKKKKHKIKKKRKLHKDSESSDDEVNRRRKKSDSSRKKHKRHNDSDSSDTESDHRKNKSKRR